MNFSFTVSLFHFPWGFGSDPNILLLGLLIKFLFAPVAKYFRFMFLGSRDPVYVPCGRDPSIFASIGLHFCNLALSVHTGFKLP